MAEFFTNPWVVGIGAALISGPIVAILTRPIFTRKVDHEYSQRVSRAKDEILSAVIPLIAEQKLPEPILIESLIRSTERKYGIPGDDLYNAKSLAEDVIKEIVSTGFLSTQQKTEFSSQVAGMIPTPGTREPGAPAASEVSWSYQASRERATKMMSFYMATMTAFVCLLGVVVTYFFSKSNADGFSFTRVALPVMAITVTFATLLSTLSMFARRLRLHSLELKAVGKKLSEHGTWDPSVHYVTEDSGNGYAQEISVDVRDYEYQRDQKIAKIDFDFSVDLKQVPRGSTLTIDGAPFTIENGKLTEFTINQTGLNHSGEVMVSAKPNTTMFVVMVNTEGVEKAYVTDGSEGSVRFWGYIEYECGYYLR